MRPFKAHAGIGVPLRRSSVDTDQIIAAEDTKRITRTGYEDALFATWRRNDKSFVLNHDAFKAGSILVAGPDFGTGSSREHAVWALMDYGFRVVISSAFADIFRGNAGKAGLLLAQCTQSDLDTLWTALESEPGIAITVDLTSKVVATKSFSCGFTIDEYTRWRLLEGLDDIDLTLRHVADIDAFEATRPAWLPSGKVAPV